MARHFVDDVGVKGLKTIFNNEKIIFRARWYILEHVQSLDRVLADIERAGATISGVKSQFWMAGLKIVGFVCDAQGRHPESKGPQDSRLA